MANELDYIKNGYPIALHYVGANVATNTTVSLTLDQGGAGFKVPSGYVAHAVFLHAESNADLTSGETATLKATDDGTALASGPEVALANTTQVDVGVARVGIEPMAAGSIVAVQIATNTTGGATADYDAVLGIVLTPG